MAAVLDELIEVSVSSSVGCGSTSRQGRPIVHESTTTILTGDGQQLHTFRWSPDGQPKAVVQIQHGLAEHAARYRRFAEALTAAGYLVYAADARGSGQSTTSGFGKWGEDGWPGWVDDVGRLTARIRQDEPGLPLGLFGHSMGSFATQQYLLDHADDVDAVVLSGSTEVGWLVPVLDADEPADLSTFNEPFEHRTGFEWLTRDEAEVDAYVADPACGWEAPRLTDIDTLVAAADPERVAAIRNDLPIHIVSGSDDPLAQGGAAVEALAEQYRRAGLTDVEVKLYPGARHELLNETNRDEVTADVIAFLDRTLTG
jgi:alpha-beta hydrolase superfamily lysophospholipase